MYKNWRVELSQRAIELFKLMRTQCLNRGHGGIKELAVLFRKMDLDFSKRICFEELRLGLEKYGMEITQSDLKLLFLSFDADENRQIDFAEFLHRLRPPLPPSRIKIIDEVFCKLDVNGDGAIKTDDLKVLYTSSSKTRTGEWSNEEEDKIESFIENYDTPDDEDGKITREEFLNYYAGVSARVPDDAFFIMTMKQCFGLPQG
ncbi:calcyphosin-like protein [Mytilus trossulus]|uniref:calcyphosin-like protein n=1 Tax=Mytilus trossulus TaxID=6551 RepID=UPI003007102E